MSRLANALLVANAWVGAFLVAFYTQAAAPDYPALFRFCLLLSAPLFLIAIVHARRVRDGRRWLTIVPAGIGLLFLGEFGFRLAS